ncbi:hypothetical protein ONS96_011661 [Cadophora gregata f. sp. sojae]|nr:hypothetical protein ONS96_011661 [Cadophora gregata f. sp. sojae]
MLGRKNPGGSSSGSAIAVSAGFAPFALGTETIGSLMLPADRAALYSLKPTVGTVSQDGIFPISSLCDAAGPMTKTTKDLADILDIILDSDKARIPEGGFSTMLTKTWQGIKIGFLEPEKWMYSETVVKYEESATDQMLAEIGDVYQRLAELAETKSVSLISWGEATDNGNRVIDKCFDRDYSAALEKYLSSLDNSKIHSLSDLIEFNETHANLELPPRYDNQNGLIRALNSNITDEEYDEILQHARHSCRDLGIDKTLKENNVDILLGPAGPLYYIAGAAGQSFSQSPR